MTQEIIVYRNPAEQAFWNLAMSGEFFVVGVTIAVWFILLLMIHDRIQKQLRRFGWSHISFQVSAVIAAIPAYFVFNKLWVF